MRKKMGIDYSTFGAPQPGRTGGDPYRYKFNGMETDPESKNGEGLDYTTEYRAYDARVGRWFSPDPVVKPWESRYAAFSNNPVVYNDPTGLNPGDPPVQQKAELTPKAQAAKDQLDQENQDKYATKGTTASQPVTASMPKPAPATLEMETPVDPPLSLSAWRISPAEAAQMKQEAEKVGGVLSHMVWGAMDALGADLTLPYVVDPSMGDYNRFKPMNETFVNVMNTIDNVAGVAVIATAGATVAFGIEAIATGAVVTEVVGSIYSTVSTTQGIVSTMAASGGMATITQYLSTNPFGHFGVEVMSEAGSLTTHVDGNQIISLVNQSKEVVLNRVTVALPNANNATMFQRNVLGQPSNVNCTTHVFDVLNAGGANLSNDWRAQYTYLRGLGFDGQNR